MDDFDFTYSQRQQAFCQGVEQGRMEADKQQLQDILQEAEQFGLEFTKQIGTYDAYIQAFEELKVAQKFPILKVNDIVHQMKSILQQIDFSSLPVLKDQRETLRKKYQILRAMLGIKKGEIIQERSNDGLDF